MAYILLVDPSPETRNTTRAWLEEAGWNVACFSHARAALETILKTPPDVVVQDYPLPDMDGLDFLSLVSACEPRIPVVLFTDNAGLRDNFRTWLAEAYLLRGDDPAPLVRAIRRIIRARARVTASAHHHQISPAL